MTINAAIDVEVMNTGRPMSCPEAMCDSMEIEETKRGVSITGDTDVDVLDFIL